MMQGKKEYRILDILSLDIRESDLKRMAAADSGQMEQYILSKLADRDISDLIQKYALPYDEGIYKILEAVDEDLPMLLNRLRAISSLSDAYQTFTGIAPDTTGTVKFIFRTEEIGG